MVLSTWPSGTTTQSLVWPATASLMNEPIQSVTRRVKGASNTVVQQPYIVKQYNDFMGGVDLFDRLLSSYRPMIRGKKMVVAIVTECRQCCSCCWLALTLSHLEFRRQVTLTLIKSPNYERYQLGGGPHGSLSVTVQYDGSDHVRVPCYQGRCRVCQKNTRVMCLKCKARLHTDRGKDCFSQFHAQKNA